MITDNEIKELFLDIKQREVKAEYHQEKGTTELEKHFFRGKKEAYEYTAKKIESLMKYKGFSL